MGSRWPFPWQPVLWPLSYAACVVRGTGATGCEARAVREGSLEVVALERLSLIQTGRELESQTGSANVHTCLGTWALHLL